MKRVNFILVIIAASLFISVGLGCADKSTRLIRAQTIIDSVSLKQVPDRRVALSEIKASFSVDKRIILKGECSIPGLKQDILNTLDKSYKNLIDSIIILPDTLTEKKNFGIVNLSVINLRSHPTGSSELVSQALLGTPVRVLKTSESWYYIQTPDGYLGWAEDVSIVPVDNSEFNRWRHADRVIYTNNSGNVFADKTKVEIISDIVLGCILVREGEEHSLITVRFPDGRKGYIPDNEAVDFNIWKENVRCDQAGIVKIASRFNGLPYLWGGTSSKGVDCSGFSKSVYFLNGIILQRDASQQALHGYFIDISNGYGQLRPGDLLFFGSRKDGTMRVTHVAIYLSENEYINASGMVIRNSLDPAKEDYNKRESFLLSARRIIGVNNDPGIVRVMDHPWY